MDWFLYDNGLRHERVNIINVSFLHVSPQNIRKSGFLTFSVGRDMEHYREIGKSFVTFQFP